MSDGFFNIKYQDLHDLSGEYRWRLEALMEGVDNMKEKINAFIDDTSFKGEGADSIKTYFREYHIPMLDGIKEAAQSLLDNVAYYKACYYSIDAATNFILSQEYIDLYNTNLYKEYTDKADGYLDDAKAALDSVSDIFSDYTYPQYYADNIGINHESTKTRLDNLIPAIQTVEQDTKNLVELLTDSFINVINLTNQSIGVDGRDFTKYESGSLDNNVCFSSLKEITAAYQDLHDENADVYNQIWSIEDGLNEAATNRELQGAAKIVGGIALVVVGGVCIVCTAGAATPAVVAAGVAIGGGTVAFGVADTMEGAQDVYYGSIGDIDSTAVNGLKEAVYACGGDDETYNRIEQVFSFAASCMTPIGVASAAGKLTVSTGITIVGKEVVSTFAGDVASKVTRDLTDSELAATVANIAVSALTSKGMDALETRVGNINIDLGTPKVDEIEISGTNGVTNIADELSGTGVAGVADDIKKADAVADVANDLPGAGTVGAIDDIKKADAVADVANDLPGAGTAGAIDDIKKADAVADVAEELPEAGVVGAVDDIKKADTVADVAEELPGAGAAEGLPSGGATDDIAGIADDVQGTSAEKVNYGDQYTRVDRKKVLKPNVEYTTPSGYTYTTDEFGNIAEVKGQLQPGSAARNQYAQSHVGGVDRLPTDDGGHLIASQFNGSGNIDNLVPMDSQINRAGGKWYEMEQTWADALNETPPRTVEVDIVPIYDAGGARPTSFLVEYTISGKGTEIVEILNQAGG